jgi:hypothetical protein
MSLTVSQRNEIERIVAAATAGDAADQDLNVLQQMLRENTDAREFYLRLIDLQTSLMWRGGAPQSNQPAAVQDPVAAALDLARQAAPLHDAGAIGTSASNPIDFPTTSFTGWLPRLGFALLVLIACASAYLAFQRSSQELPNIPVAQQPPAAPAPKESNKPANASAPAPAPAAGAIARLTGTWDAIWDGPEATRKNGDLILPGQQLELTGGLAEVTFECGAVVILQSPVKFVAESAHGASLVSGRLAARVPGPAAKFWIKTPSMNVFDLGTEFGVAVESSGASQVRVFEGSVEVEPLASAATPDQPNAAADVAKNRKLIMAGQVGLVEPRTGYSEKLAEVDSSESFVREMPNNYVEDYAAAINASRPWGYWSFNSVITSTLIPDMSGHGRFGQLNGDAMVVQGRSILAVGQAVAFDGDGDSATIPTGATLSLNSDFSIETLFRTNSTGPLISKIPSDGSWKPGAKILFSRGGDVRFTPCLRGKRLATLGARVHLNDGLWHHVVLTNKADVSGKRDRTILYVDGVERNRKTDWDITSHDDEGMPIKLGAACLEYPVDDVLKATQLPTRSFFTGHLDESAVYTRCLSPDEVTAHYRSYIRAGMATRTEPLSPSSVTQTGN